jgi:GDP-mannose transporter
MIASWTDVKNAVVADPTTPPSAENPLGTDYMNVVRNLNVGYFWMLVNCIVSAAYVRLFP